MLDLNSPISELGGFFKRFEKPLKRVDVVTIRDVLWYFPNNYEDRRIMFKIKDLKNNDNLITIKCRIDLLQTKRSVFKRSFITEGLVSDGTGSLRIVWFGNMFISKVLKVGDEVYFSGRVYSDHFGLQMRSPEYEKVKLEDNIHSAVIVPRYPLTKGLTNKQLRFVISKALSFLKEIEDWIPEIIIKRNGFCCLSEALKSIHFPRDWKDYRIAKRRLAFNELFRVQLRSFETRKELQQSTAPEILFQEEKIKEWVLQMPFQLTNDQKKASWRIIKDTTRSMPMNRLLQGDVGSGKTAVAALAMFHACAGGYSAVLMSPTDILARQHFATLQKLFSSTSFTIVLYTRMEHIFWRAGIIEECSKKECVKKIAQGNVQIVIGTHALLYEPLKFPNLGLVIVDEQHRFGVAQRRRLKERSTSLLVPHFLSMTATPIPRSVALALYGELDVSVIREKPTGRKSVITKIVYEHNREQAYAFVRNQIDRGRQVFIVCPLIEESDELNVVSVEEIMKMLINGPFKNYRVVMLHGKMKSNEKEKIMQNMVNGEIDVLVSTSVIEVGVDVPNATVMMIEGAERFGLAQLHQFRGRIGRAEHQSYCFVFPSVHSNPQNERLLLFEKTLDGFALAQADFELRGGGDIYGIAQSGFPDLKIASLQDIELVEIAKKEAKIVFDEDCEKIQFPLLWRAMEEWEDGKVHLE